MIPVNAGENLPACPSQCADAIWTFFDERLHDPAGEIREAVEVFRALDLSGDPREIPIGSRLTEVDLGTDPKLAAFHLDGRVYFASADELLRMTKAISA
jgi:hypothetical protein